MSKSATEMERMLPLYEGKMGNQFDYRTATFLGIGDTDISPNHNHLPESVTQPRYWIRESVTNDRLNRRSWGTNNALLGFRRVARNTDERTCIAALIPFGAASYGWIVSAGPDARELAILEAQYNSFVFDYLVRQFLSQPSIPQGTVQQIPTVTPDILSRNSRILGNDPAGWISSRAVELSVTGLELVPFADELGVDGAPFAWDPERRERIRAELDAAFFHLYGVNRDDVEYIMDTFPIVKRKDEAAFGEYRTKRLILEFYDELAGHGSDDEISEEG